MLSSPRLAQRILFVSPHLNPTPLCSLSSFDADSMLLLSACLASPDCSSHGTPPESGRTTCARFRFRCIRRNPSSVVMLRLVAFLDFYCLSIPFCCRHIFKCSIHSRVLSLEFLFPTSVASPHPHFICQLVLLYLCSNVYFSFCGCRALAPPVY